MRAGNPLLGGTVDRTWSSRVSYNSSESFDLQGGADFIWR